MGATIMQMQTATREKQPVSTSMDRKKRVLIISTYRTSCGIATFTDTLETLLGGEYAVEVGVLDQFLLKAMGGQLEKAGDDLIDNIVDRAREVDIVNLQWEPGLLGRTERHMLRRFTKLLRANSNLIVTVHTVVPAPAISFRGLLEEVFLRGVLAATRYWMRNGRFGRNTYRALAEAGKNPQFQVIVHTKREKRFFREAVGIPNVHDHPLSYIRRGWEEKLPEEAKRIRSDLTERFGDRKFIGFFGFLTEYKGIQTAVEALRFLPQEYMLLLYGGVHPGLIREGELNDPYVEKIMNAVDPPRVDGEQVKASVVDRVQFLGAPDDFRFAASIMACDINVFPYVEIGQSASGPVSQSVELGKRTVVSNNFMFEQFSRYFPGRTERADIGNYIHLAQAIMRAMSKPEPGSRGLGYNNQTLAEFYSRVFEQASTPLEKKDMSFKSHGRTALRAGSGG